MIEESEAREMAAESAKGYSLETEFAHLWTAPPGKYVLEKSIVEGEEFLLICCPDEGAVVLIDDDVND